MVIILVPRPNPQDNAEVFVQFWTNDGSVKAYAGKLRLAYSEWDALRFMLLQGKLAYQDKEFDVEIRDRSTSVRAYLEGIE